MVRHTVNQQAAMQSAVSSSDQGQAWRTVLHCRSTNDFLDTRMNTHLVTLANRLLTSWPLLTTRRLKEEGS